MGTSGEATALANSVVFYEEVTEWLSELCEKVRKRFREVPASVAAMLASDGNEAHYVRECILYQLDRARLDCGGQSQGELVEPKPGNVVDDEPLEDVDGHAAEDEFEDA